MTKDVSQAWGEISLENLAKFIDYRGKTPKKTPMGVPLITAKNIRDGYINREPREFIAEEAYDTWMTRGIPRVGDVVITTEAPMGNVASVNIKEKFALAQRAICLQPYEQATGKFLEFFLRSNYFKAKLSENATGTTVRGIKATTLKKLNILFPPLAEQKAITEKLDSLLAQVEATKTRLEGIPDILKQFRQSVLAAAVSGELTEDWREDHSSPESANSLKARWLSERRRRFSKLQKKLVEEEKIKRPRKFKEPILPDLETVTIDDAFPKSWEIVSVSEMADCLDSERIPVKRDDRQSTMGKYPYFGANGEVDRVDQYIFDDDLVLVTEDETFYGREKPIAYRFTGKCWVNNHAHVLRALTKEANDYLCFSLMYYNVIPWLSGTTGRAKLTQAALNRLPLGLPPEQEISEIVQRVEELFAFADNIEAKAKTALASVNHLTQSILAQAFSGELTKDWRQQNPDLISGENSAEALLKRIQAERETLKPAKKKRKPA